MHKYRRRMLRSKMIMTAKEFENLPTDGVPDKAVRKVEEAKYKAGYVKWIRSAYRDGVDRVQKQA